MTEQNLNTEPSNSTKPVLCNGLKCTDLRIGNYVYDSYSGFMEVDSITKEYVDLFKIGFLAVGRFSIDSIKPISLTEEWLLKFGFIRKYGSCFLSTPRGTIQIEEDLAEISSVITHKGFMSPCEYVHQLQNLYFALTGDELTVA